MNKKATGFGQIILWLGIFIVGSLIVTFLVNPNSFENFKSNLKSIVPQYETQEVVNGTSSVITNKFEKLNLADYGRNPEKFLGKNVTFKAKVTGSPGMIFVGDNYFCLNNAWTVADNEGYQAVICTITQRDFESDRVYNFKGTVGSITNEGYVSLASVKRQNMTKIILFIE